MIILGVIAYRSIWLIWLWFKMFINKNKKDQSGYAIDTSF